MPKTPEEVAGSIRRKPRNVRPINIHFDMPRYNKILKAAQEEDMLVGKFIMFAVDHYFSCDKK